MAIDVRELSEFKRSHIPGAKLIPLKTLPAQTAGLDKEQPVLLICQSGARSMQAADFLAKQGFQKVYNLLGGMLKWSGPIER